MSFFKNRKQLVYNERVRYTQAALNEILPDRFNLVTDGLFGRKTEGALREFDGILSEIFDLNSYSVVSGVNLVAIRMGDKFTNRFTDFYIVWNTEHIGMTKIYPCSTKSGLPRVLNPRWVAGKFGVAVIKEGQYKDVYSFQSNWWSGLPFLYQVRPITVFRDGILNKKIDRIGEQTGLFGINHHSWRGFAGELLGNLSEGCVVFKPSVLKLLVPDWRIASTEQSDKIDFTLLNIKDFKIFK